MRELQSQTGDTIVEVMIAMAVAMSVLGSAYTITNKSLANNRMAYEHSEALKIAQSQVEQIRILALQSPATAPVFSPTAASCIATRNGTVTRGQLKTFTAVSTLPDSNPSNYPPECRDIGSVAYRTGFRYNAATNTYTVYVNWDGATGTPSEVKSTYKVYPGV